MGDRIQKVIIYDLDDTLFDSTGQPKDDGKNWSIKLFDGLQEMLDSKKHLNILVTRGNKELQDRKIDVLGLRKNFLSIYIVESDRHKHEQFKKIMIDFPDKEIVIVGNRIDCEIRYGNQLGLKTIHIRHGKYMELKPRDQFEIPSESLGLGDLNNLEGYL
ncbi:MAG: hypothetical protein AAB610_02250 [Patescibacteria group bacterium]